MMITETTMESWEKSVDWERLVELAAKAANLCKQEITWIRNSLAAKIITATAFYSGCKEKERLSIAHLTTLVAGARLRNLFDQKKGESIYERLCAGRYYQGGNEEVVKAGMLLLEYLSLNDHKTDAEEDLKNKKYNPLLNGLDYESEKKRITCEWDALPDQIKNRFLIFYKKSINAVYWYA